mmetsp:Transcript_750/g.3042  ORF Transcript_750/g.3042 Transcript_750/m.3042 type:complete len:540 (+) Transcript_750:4198-5817(+)
MVRILLDRVEALILQGVRIRIEQAQRDHREAVLVRSIATERPSELSREQVILRVFAIQHRQRVHSGRLWLRRKERNHHITILRGNDLCIDDSIAKGLEDFVRRGVVLQALEYLDEALRNALVGRGGLSAWITGHVQETMRQGEREGSVDVLRVHVGVGLDAPLQGAESDEERVERHIWQRLRETGQVRKGPNDLLRSCRGLHIAEPGKLLQSYSQGRSQHGDDPVLQLALRGLSGQGPSFHRPRGLADATHDLQDCVKKVGFHGVEPRDLAQADAGHVQQPLFDDDHDLGDHRQDIRVADPNLTQAPRGALQHGSGKRLERRQPVREGHHRRRGDRGVGLREGWLDLIVHLRKQHAPDGPALPVHDHEVRDRDRNRVQGQIADNLLSRLLVQRDSTLSEAAHFLPFLIRVLQILLVDTVEAQGDVRGNPRDDQERRDHRGRMLDAGIQHRVVARAGLELQIHRHRDPLLAFVANCVPEPRENGEHQPCWRRAAVVVCVYPRQVILTEGLDHGSVQVGGPQEVRQAEAAHVAGHEARVQI